MRHLNPSLRSLGFCVLALALPATLSVASDAKSTYVEGQMAPHFQTKDITGRTINFPEDYKGKVVLLDFWATWCGPCRAELPNVVSAYQTFHGQGFEIVGISLDRPNAGPKLVSFMKENGMSWAQVYDGGYWQAALAQKYGIHSIPRPILVDGDTGTILAEGPAARGSRLASAIEKAIASKHK